MSVSSDRKSSDLQLGENTNGNTDRQKIRLVSNAAEAKGLSFKDWKTIKNGEKLAVNKQTGSRNASTTHTRDCRKGNADFGANRKGNAGFPPHYSSIPEAFNDLNRFNMRGNGFGTPNNIYFNSFNNIGFNNGYNEQINYIKNNCNVLDNFNGQHANHFMNVPTLPDSFFTSDGFYPQKDSMQKPLRNALKKYAGTNKHNSEIKTSGVDPNNAKKAPASSVNEKSATKDCVATKATEEPKIYVPNPNASKDGKAFILKPRLPEENPQISKEEKKQQWKEYREAMKPFKNREFYNAKRVVQRLGKRDINELNEKELLRLKNAREVMSAHKARLTAKYSDYVKAEGKSNELGEVYVLKKPGVKDSEAEKVKSKCNQNSNNVHQTHRNSINVPARKILGGYSNFKRFVPCGMFKDTTQRTGQISNYP